MQLPFMQKLYSWTLILERSNLCSHTKTCTQIVIAALLLRAQTQKQSSCPSTDESLRKPVQPHHGILFSTKKKGNIDTCNNLDEFSENYIMWGGKSQSEGLPAWRPYVGQSVEHPTPDFGPGHDFGVVSLSPQVPLLSGHEACSGFPLFPPLLSPAALTHTCALSKKPTKQKGLSAL